MLVYQRVAICKCHALYFPIRRVWISHRRLRFPKGKDHVFHAAGCCGMFSCFFINHGKNPPGFNFSWEKPSLHRGILWDHHIPRGQSHALPWLLARSPGTWGNQGTAVWPKPGFWAKNHRRSQAFSPSKMSSPKNGLSIWKPFVNSNYWGCHFWGLMAHGKTSKDG